MVGASDCSTSAVRSGFPMPTDAITCDLARAAHALWCRRMIAGGWKYGESFDPEQRTHDALVPFDRLNVHDQNSAILTIRTERVEEILCRAIDYPRGPDRPFTPEEMRVGLPVGWAATVTSKDPLRDIPREIGTVDSWELDADGQELSLIRVRWPGGDIFEHYPSQRDLRRLT